MENGAKEGLIDSSNATVDKMDTGCRIKLRPNLALNGKPKQWIIDRSTEEWVSQIFPTAAIFKGYDNLIWGNFFIVVYREILTEKFSSIIIDKLGLTHFNSIDISRQSRFYPAVENLTDVNQKSNVRKLIAISLLRKYADIDSKLIKKISPEMKYDYDPTIAGDLANSCELFGQCTPEEFGESLSQLGVLRDRFINSILLDVVYENKAKIIDSNNELVFHLGEQLEQLFNPLSEYSPEQTEYVYKSPDDGYVVESEDPLIVSICNELLQLQTNFTLSLVEFLQNFLIPLRIEVANDEIDGLSIPKLNRLFPPTIDEVTRINCIFLDALKSATPYGSAEVLKACSVTIPYFYKAYTRHEAATKNFSKDIKLFLSKFGHLTPNRDVYTELKIETLIKGPQEKIMKLKLIIERLWSNENLVHDDAAKKRYDDIIETIHSFGTLEKPMSAYSTRVFTPSGKILTELAKGWPVELQYKWLKRRVVGVFDMVDADDKAKRDILVIFSDYVVFLRVIGGEDYYNMDGNKPLISDILMNSLINEVPLPSKIPKLEVLAHTYIDKVLVSTYGSSFLRFDLRDKNFCTPLTYELASNSMTTSEVADLVTKAQILEKDTAFHLFKYSNDYLQIYSTAHELSAYSTEKIKSQFALFLNLEPSIELIEKYGLCMALFASFRKDHQVNLTRITVDNARTELTVPLHDLAETLANELVDAIPIYFSSLSSPFYEELLQLNAKLVQRIGKSFRKDELTIQENKNDKAPEKTSSAEIIYHHQKNKSFGTITTFRSFPSDMKELSDNNTINEKIKDKSKHGGSKARKTVNRDIANHPPKQMGLIKTFKNLFGRRKKSRKENERLTISSPHITSPKTESKANSSITRVKKTIGDPKSHVRESQEVEHLATQPAESSRVSSVIHTPSRNITDCVDISKESMSSMNRKAQAGVEKNSTENSSSTQLQDYEINHSSLSVHSEKEVLPDSVKATGTPYKESLRQSKVFNDDPFASVISSDENESIGPAKDNLCGESLTGETSVSVKDSKLVGKEADEPTIHKEDNHFAKTLAEKVELKPSIPEVHDTAKSFEGPIDSRRLSEGRCGQEFENAQIFPKVQGLKTKTIDFCRSPSFVELFDGMRAILDITDESTNWRRLSSEGSLTIQTTPHAEDVKALDKNCIKGNSSAIMLDKSNHSNMPDARKSSPDHRDENDDARIFASSKVSEPEYGQLNLDFSKSEGTLTPVFPTFKVVNTSPAKIVNFATSINNVHPDLTNNSTRESSSPVKNSYSSDLNAENLRLVELSFNSQDDVYSYDSRQKPNDILETLPPSHSIHSPRLSNSEVNSKPLADQLSATTSVEVANLQNELVIEPLESNILGDLDFSSFNMTFDISNELNDSTQESIMDEPKNPFVRKPHLSPRDPVFYRLPNSTRSDETFFSCVDDQRNKGQKRKSYINSLPLECEDEPMWVSPSKIDMFDLSKQPDSVFQELKLRSKQTREAKFQLPGKANRSSTEEQLLLPDSSYAYLGSLLTDDDMQLAEISSDDRPVRLKFNP
ncbi:LAFE_0F09868g1_1 [Lachancea fermentati]|uniref:LAFE_0F09868g1_1 n=1 Tax=Lachancea fermentati TaxID=4955 RepID=A0A1G4MFR6_LACFM|nr:LAFE_0F09868g1_1 [Lachancea fermentati]